MRRSRPPVLAWLLAACTVGALAACEGGFFGEGAGGGEAAASASGQAGDNEGEGPPAGGGFTFPVTYVEIGGGTVEEVVEFPGDVATRRRAALAFERAGRVDAIFVDEGDRVDAGDVLARLEDRVLQAELAAARAQADAARAQKEHAERELQRFLGMGDAAPEADRDLWRSEVAIRAATWEQRKAEAQRLERLIEQSTLRAPFAGVIVARHLTLGSYAHAGDLVFELLDLQRREVRLELPQQFATTVQPGVSVTVRSQALPGGSLQATLDVVLPSAEPDARTFTGLVRLGPEHDPEVRLLPGAFVHARLVARRAETETVVPADALLETPRGWVVVVAAPAGGDGADAGGGGSPPQARFVPVHVLARTADRVAVAPQEEGALTSGARVVVTGVDNVFPGAPLLLQPHRDPAEDGRGEIVPSEPEN